MEEKTLSKKNFCVYVFGVDIVPTLLANLMTRSFSCFLLVVSVSACRLWFLFHIELLITYNAW